ncbi:hypothetical protein BBO99_00007580 [Phytophthora kernoviae]|uniref:PX domain-containing protein n=2 Tax=Phytophthora kernoviae TaxID=325452 RepID=A0A3R7G743_9STRA|nr:hypothetical protein G195_009158 [Phytophthora kernoviae 00238/432]KAG2510685.1 hypothetical protein JM16_007273 [Phytophthora kernoviae]KAG2520321.1 hypothetical protein JM18_007168 [Phytophthora kernoviae]RLN43949.1 hypothetical protein BBI17_006711 [Phytophthora kernoviae]RLN76404.1 hypothetical protein BBO99_00007580 [Phytophthora kernoviae]
MALPRSPYNSVASRKRSSPAVKQMPEAVAWIKDIKLEMTTTTTARSGAEYELRVIVQAKGANATSWTVRHSFDQYKTFQKRLLSKLQPSHSCKAECRWLHSTIKKHFPKQSLFGSRYPTIIEQRRKALLRLLTMVIHEFAAFIVGSGNTSGSALPETHSEIEIDTPRSMASFTSVTSDEGEEDVVTMGQDHWDAWSLPVQHQHLGLERTLSSPV